MKLLKIKDNSQVKKDTFSDIENLTNRIADPLPEEFHYSWLVNVPEMFSRRAPGNTCLSALEQGGNGRIDKPINHSKGCGGIMRVAPIGIYFAGKGYPGEKIDAIGARAAALTHGHELGYIPAAMLVHILQQIIDHGDSIFEAVRSTLVVIPTLYPKAKHMREFIDLIQKAVSLSEEQLDDLDAIRQLGEGWVAEETLAIAVYCALKYADDFEKGIIAAVNHDGDSDSTGAVAGNILGTALGFDSVEKLSVDNDANATWISSLASYWGGILGGVFSGIIAIFGVFYTIQFTRETDRNKERQAIQPFLNLNIISKPSGTVKQFQIADEPKYVDGKAIQEFYPIYLSIMNIGNGFASTLTFGTGENMTGVNFKEVFTTNQTKEILLNVQTSKMGKGVAFFIWFADSMTNEYIQYYEIKRNSSGIGYDLDVGYPNLIE